MVQKFDDDVCDVHRPSAASLEQPKQPDETPSDLWTGWKTAVVPELESVDEHDEAEGAADLASLGL